MFEGSGVRRLDRTDQSDPTDPSDQLDAAPYAQWLVHKDPAIVANAVICLIHQANYLLDRQIAGLEREFIEGGGYTETLAAARIEHRQAHPERDTPACPACGKPMALRMVRKGQNAGKQFWGCFGYPDCTGTRELD